MTIIERSTLQISLLISDSIQQLVRTVLHKFALQAHNILVLVPVVADYMNNADATLNTVYSNLFHLLTMDLNVRKYDVNIDNLIWHT